MNLKEKISSLIKLLPVYWKKPMDGRFMSFREIAAYAGGGIGVYFLFTVGTACILGTGNTLISSTLGVDATDMYILYVIAVIANIPLTGIRAAIIDNTRNRAGKYRPYIITMGIPTAIVCIAMVWFPYDKLGAIVGEGIMFGDKSRAYVAKCAIILVLNFILHFCYYFFYDGYENLIHVLSPNTQERADVSSIKSVVYSLSPSITNLITPIIAYHVFDTNMTDIRVYRLLYPIFGIVGIAFCIIVYKGTEEKIVCARTHVASIKFTDAIKEVSKNKYFWIISLASWIGFLESAYANILYWLYNYGGACNGDQYGIIVTVYGNASLWGMLLAPFCIRRWGKKSVLVVTNLFNIVCILLMLPVTAKLENSTIWMVLGCLYLNAFMGSFAHILNPAIQADIRDYQQYRSGERIDGMFSAVATIGTVVTLATSSVLPMIYEKGGLTQENAIKVTSDPDVLSRILGDGKTVGQLLAEQALNHQDNYSNSYSALYDTNVLLNLLHVLIIVSAVGALMNVIPYFWYDFNEIKQKSVVRVLKIRAMFEDFGNGALSDSDLKEGVEAVRKARELNGRQLPDISKKALRSDKKACSTKEEKKEISKQYKEKKALAEEIQIAEFVCKELDKFSTSSVIHKYGIYKTVYSGGIDGLKNLKADNVKQELSEARSMPKTTAEEKELRKISIELAKQKLSSVKQISKNYSEDNFCDPGLEKLENFIAEEDRLENEIKNLYEKKKQAKKNRNTKLSSEIENQINLCKKQRKKASADAKKETDIVAAFNRAAKPYFDAKRLVLQKANYEHFHDIEQLYDQKIKAGLITE